MRSALVASLLLVAAACNRPAADLPETVGLNDSVGVAVGTSKSVWQVPHRYIVRALESAPESLLAFTPTPGVRSLGSMFAHVADGEYLFCGEALDQTREGDPVEQTAKTKADLLRALAESERFCNRAYAMTDSVAQLPGDFVGLRTNRLYLLTMNAAHAYEHYGNIVTYLRLNGITPPSSQRQ
jgi:uncharacterized damage-inducible protein DinB